MTINYRRVKHMKIYLDFDGTVVEHEYPRIGKYNTGCFEVLKKLEKAGHQIILNTYRADCNDGTLLEAINYIKTNSLVTIHSVEPKKIMPIPWDWEFFKLKNLIFIDDICRGVPLKREKNSRNEIVDWKAIDKEFYTKGIYETNVED